MLVAVFHRQYLIKFKVCKESIQMEEVINNFTINFYAGEIEFDAGGVAKITCEKTPEANIVVDCCPNQVAIYVAS